MSGDHNRYQKPDYVDRRQWKYDPMTGEPLVDGWPLYSGLPQREWQGLTDEEVFAALVAVDGNTQRLAPGFVAFYCAIEAKLKEKNT